MRFYERDGSCKINQEDCEFGWWFCDILAEEDPADRNRGSREEGKYLIFQRNEIEDSTDLTCFSECNKKFVVEKHEPSVEVHVPVGVQRSQMSPEGYVGNDDLNPFGVSDVIPSNRVKHNRRALKFENVNSIKENLSALISSGTFEGMLLMSFLDIPRFKNLNTSASTLENRTISIPDLKGPSAFLNCPFIVHDFNLVESQVCSSIRSEINNYENEKSLMAEIPSFNGLSETDDVTNLYDSAWYLRASEKLNCLPSDCLKLRETETSTNKFLECIELLCQNLRKLDKKIRDMQQELIGIRIDFQVEDARTARLLQESRKFSREFRESNYMNEVVLLLRGQAEKIKSRNWPFKICSNGKDDLNLII